MATYTHTLTAIESACGVTLAAVAEVMPKVLLIDEGHAVVIPRDVAPALAGSVARCVFSGRPVEFSHLSNRYPVYRLA